jgi:Fe-S oxidoreductase
VLLWPDTFTNYLTPEVGRAATRVLVSAGMHVTVPQRGVCCGLTWITTGQLGVARRVLRRSLASITSYVGSDVWVVGMEPSCTAALRSDVKELFPDDPAVQWLASRVLTFAQALDRLAAPNWAPHVDRTTISQTHCHQHAVLGTDAEARVMQRLGVRNTFLDSGCCGLAGNFGFERGHLEVSLAVAEHALLPAVRAAPEETVVLADGFSCRTQVDHALGRDSRHLAQLIDEAMA